MRERLNKCIVPFDYFGKSLIVLSVTDGSISIASFATVIGAPVGIASASFSLAFLMSTEIMKILQKTTPNKKKKHKAGLISFAVTRQTQLWRCRLKIFY